MDCKKIHLESVDSTMDYAKAHVSEYDPNHLSVIYADEQTKARGRFNRVWQSPKGENIYATFYFTLEKNDPHICSLAQLMTLSVACVLLEEDIDVKVRWPNDILIHDKKVAGILCETSQQKTHIDVFLGVGINVDTDEKILKTIDRPATSLKKQTNRSWEKHELLDKIIEKFMQDLIVFKQKGFASFLNAFDNLLAYKGEKIICSDGNQQWEGICHSLNNEGQLNLYLPNGDLKTFSAADVSLKI